MHVKRFFIWASVFVITVSLCLTAPAQAADHAVVMEAYKAVLQNEVTFYSINNKKNYKLNELKDERNEQLEVKSFAVVDMDSDGMPEVVLDLGGPYYGVLVLHYEEGNVYGFNTSYTYYLSNDGTYNGSLQAWYFTYCKVTSITKDTYKVETLARVEVEDIEAEGDPFFYIGESKVTKDEHDAFIQSLLESRQENEAVWHDYTYENIASFFKF